MSVHIVTAGLQTTVQDLGRVGHQADGVPAGGAMDRAALRAGNALVGNDEGAAGLEATLIAPTITFDQPTLIALTGGEFDATVDGTSVGTWRPLYLPAGATLRFGHARVGCRVYLLVAGGVDAPPVFGSHSTYLRGGFGGCSGRALRAGDVLATGTPSALSRTIAQSFGDIGSVAVAKWNVHGTLRPRYSDSAVVHVLPGAHLDALDDASRACMFGEAFRVSSSSDRMGYRLEGTPLALQAPIEILSEGVAFGTVQLPPGGAPIILMADRQTTGGYPRIAEVASIDLPIMAQLRPGDRVRFVPIPIGEAQRLYLEQEQDLAQARFAIALRHPHHRATP